MKNTHLSLLVILYLCITTINVSNSYGQTSNEDRITAIPTLINNAVEKGDYETAAKLKKEKELRLQIKDALANENFDLAEKLKRDLDGGPVKAVEVITNTPNNNTPQNNSQYDQQQSQQQQYQQPQQNNQQYNNSQGVYNQNTNSQSIEPKKCRY